MRHNDIIYLLSTETEYDDIGNPIETTTERMVYANRFEVSASEFYEASAQGLKPEKKFEIFSYEYNDESELKHDDQVYQITLVQGAGEKTRITCEKDIGK